MKELANKYRLVCFDLMNLGLNSRSTSKECHKSPEASEQWCREFAQKVITNLDIPETFLLSGHSWGGWLAMSIASMMPERIESLFCISPAGNEAYDPKNYDKYNYVKLDGG
jgi:pimeloyl-ACP methyl ester carboxylesterase